MKSNKIKFDELGIGEFFLFQENLYVKITHNVEYYLVFAKPRSCSISKVLDGIYEQVKEWSNQKNFSAVSYRDGINAFNLTNNYLTCIRGDIPVTPVKGAVTIENEQK